MRSRRARSHPRRKRVGSAEKLRLLRENDRFREWQSLRDRRVCVLCERTFSGRRVKVHRTSAGALELTCPTPGCNSTPHEWVYPGNPLISEASWRDWLRVFNENEALA